MDMTIQEEIEQLVILPSLFPKNRQIFLIRISETLSLNNMYRSSEDTRKHCGRIA